MKIVYDADSDILDLIFSQDEVEESDEIKEGVIIDYGKDGKVVSIEILDASVRITDPNKIQYEIMSNKVA